MRGGMQAFCGTDVKEWYSRTATHQPVQWVADLIATFKSSFPKVGQSQVPDMIPGLHPSDRLCEGR